MKDIQNKKCFIVNRGEVLKRISSTLKKLGISSVAISDGSNFTKENIDILLKEKHDFSIYLDRDKLIDLSLKNTVDMIHPGYGFLSEDAEFAKQVQDSGLIWIGPSYKAIKALSNKYSSKIKVSSLGIPTIKSSEVFDPLSMDLESILSLVKDFSFPLIAKNIYSGGGKGIRIIRNNKDFYSLIKACAIEGKKYFSDPSIIVEEYLEDVSHIEVQIVSDKYGNNFVLGTRQCSIQRRNQKILEEAPANIDDNVFKKLREYSLKIAEDIGYDSLGTIEFLVDKKKENIYFLEANTRLQVEHGVSEEIYDIDLVELQIKIANGFNLKEDRVLFNKLKEIDNSNKASKHSIEIRLCSEVPFSFLPCSGRKKIIPVFYKDHIRWDSGIDLDKDVEIEEGFDSLLSKIIVTAGSREDVIDIFNNKLFPSLKIEGVTNIDLFKSIFKEKDFLDNLINTQYLSNHIDKLKELNTSNYNESSRINVPTSPSLEEITEFAFSKDLVFKYIRSSEFSPIKIDKYSQLNSFNNIKVSDNSNSYGKDIESTNKNSSQLIDKKDNNQNKVYPPVPGKILSLHVKEGDIVKKNDMICTIESMKMEIEVVSEYSGKIEFVTDHSWVNTSDAIVSII